MINGVVRILIKQSLNIITYSDNAVPKWYALIIQQPANR